MYGKQELVSRSTSLLIATFNGHFPICKFIIEIIKDVHKAITWGKTLIAIANLNGHNDVSRLLENAFQITGSLQKFSLRIVYELHRWCFSDF